MGDVINLNLGDDADDLTPADVLTAAIERDLEEVVVIGLTKEGDFYLYPSSSYAPDIVWLLQYAQKFLLEME